MSSPELAATEEFRLALNRLLEYGRSWWLHDAQVDDLVRRTRGLRRELELASARGLVETTAVYAQTPDPKSQTDWRTDRIAVHKSVVGQVLAFQRLRGKEPQRRVYVTLGLPGSGKSTTLRPVAWGHYAEDLKAVDRSRWTAGAAPPGGLALDADDLRISLPEYASGLGSQILQPETAYLRYQQADPLNLPMRPAALLLDIVGDPTHLVAEAAILSRQGYDLYFLMTQCSVDVAVDRATSRFLTTGRYVPESYIRGKDGVPRAALDAVLSSGLPVKGWGVWSTDGPLAQVDGGGSFAPP